MLSLKKQVLGRWNFRKCILRHENESKQAHCLNARTAKTNWKTTPTLKHMLKVRKLPTNWMSEKNLSGLKKASNRALKIGNNTQVPLEGWFRGVLPAHMQEGGIHNRQLVGQIPRPLSKFPVVYFPIQIQRKFLPINHPTAQVDQGPSYCPANHYWLTLCQLWNAQKHIGQRCFLSDYVSVQHEITDPALRLFMLLILFSFTSQMQKGLEAVWLPYIYIFLALLAWIFREFRGRWKQQ